MKYRVWVIDDRIEDELVGEALAKLKQIDNIEIKTSPDWNFPPDFLEKEESLANQLPDIVVLDLYENGDKFKGNTFYTELRNHEKRMERTHPCFVIAWSDYTGPAYGFITANKNSDAFFVATGTKAIRLLIEAVNDCLGRILEERQ